MQLLEIPFLRNCRVVDIDAPLGTAVLDARDLPREESAGRCTSSREALPDRGKRLG